MKNYLIRFAVHYTVYVVNEIRFVEEVPDGLAVTTNRHRCFEIYSAAWYTLEGIFGGKNALEYC